MGMPFEWANRIDSRPCVKGGAEVQAYDVHNKLRSTRIGSTLAGCTRLPGLAPTAYTRLEPGTQVHACHLPAAQGCPLWPRAQEPSPPLRRPPAACGPKNGSHRRLHCMLARSTATSLPAAAHIQQACGLPSSSCPQPTSKPLLPSRAGLLLISNGGRHQIRASLRHQLCGRQAHRLQS